MGRATLGADTTMPFTLSEDHLAFRQSVRAMARSRYADSMLEEKEFFIRKAIGWVLRELAQRYPAWVATWTTAHTAEMSGVTFREATRRLPPDVAAELRALRSGKG